MRRWWNGRRLTALGLVAAAQPILAGCLLFVDKQEDLSANKDAWGGWSRETLYVTRQPLILYDNAQKTRLCVDTQVTWPIELPEDSGRDGGLQWMVVDATMVAEGSNNFPGITLLPAGSSIRAEGIRKRTTIETSSLEVLGSVVSGPRAGTRVELSPVSVRTEHFDWLAPNPDLIRPATPTTDAEGRGTTATPPYVVYSAFNFTYSLVSPQEKNSSRALPCPRSRWISTSG